MASKAFIAIENSDNSVDFTRCRHDGFDLGSLLIEHYSSASKLKELIALGEIWTLEKDIYPDESKEHLITGKNGITDLNRRQKDVSLFTYRDIDRTNKKIPLFDPFISGRSFFDPDIIKWDQCKPIHFENSLYFREQLNCDYTYLYDKRNIWWVCFNKKWQKLEDHLERERLLEWPKLEDHLERERLLEWFITEFKTFSELDAHEYIKRQFFDFALKHIDLKDAKDYLESFPYSKCKHFETLDLLMVFVKETVIKGYEESVEYYRGKKHNLFEIAKELLEEIETKSNEDLIDSFRFSGFEIIGNKEIPSSGFLVFKLD
ncbi:hypothetical protein [Helicobacter sp. 13S00482-2]|uniref:hypothetical protein n=1 Tax=Helicobacter sp. 13S00482-2 TaxID=1476200 RepID=UPI0011798ECC|nr:hypothetical protein [Helicobacter sp. 13S00482-2]